LAKIKTIELADGSKRYRFVLDVGKNAAGKRMQRTYTYRRLTDARAEYARLSNDVTRKQFVDRWNGTVGELCDSWLRHATYGKELATVSSYQGALRIPRLRLGQRKAASITREDIEQLRNWALEHGRVRGGQPGTSLSPRSIALMLGRLSAAFELAIWDRRLSVNPCAYVAMPRQVRAERATWSDDEARRFLKIADVERLAAAWRMTLYGARRGEVCGLRWEDVDLEAGTVTLGALTRVLVSGRVVEKAGKSANAVRTLPLDDSLVAALRALRKQQAAERLAAGPAYSASGYVAVDELGYPVHPEGYSDHFARLCREAGVPVIRLHDARHTANSLMASAGVPPHIRAAWCGHTVAVNTSTYTHARAEDLVMARDALSAAYSGAV
jgi:integrase